MKRFYEIISIILFLTGITGISLSLLFLCLYQQRFIEAFVAGGFSLLVLRGGILVLRLLTARASLDESHKRILHQMEDRG